MLVERKAGCHVANALLTRLELMWPIPNLKSSVYINNSLHLARKFARIVVRRHYPRSSQFAHCSRLGTDNVQGQISEHIFASNGGYCLYILQMFYATRAVLKIGEYPQYSWESPSTSLFYIAVKFSNFYRTFFSYHDFFACLIR